MHTFILQDWTTIEGSGAAGTSGADIVQSKDDWLDLASYQDVTFWLDVRNVSTVTGGAASVTMYFETSPTADDSLFQAMITPTATNGLSPMVAAAAPTIVKAPMYAAAVPIGRFLRWHLRSNTANWSVTFRVLVAANSPGL